MMVKDLGTFLIHPGTIRNFMDLTRSRRFAIAFPQKQLTLARRARLSIVESTDLKGRLISRARLAVDSGARHSSTWVGYWAD